MKPQAVCRFCEHRLSITHDSYCPVCQWKDCLVVSCDCGRGRKTLELFSESSMTREIAQEKRPPSRSIPAAIEPNPAVLSVNNK
jgi:hypothetical protein